MCAFQASSKRTRDTQRCQKLLFRRRSQFYPENICPSTTAKNQAYNAKTSAVVTSLPWIYRTGCRQSTCTCTWRPCKFCFPLTDTRNISWPSEFLSLNARWPSSSSPATCKTTTSAAFFIMLGSHMTKKDSGETRALCLDDECGQLSSCFPIGQ